MFKLYYNKNDSSPSEICFNEEQAKRSLKKARDSHPEAWLEKCGKFVYKATK